MQCVPCQNVISPTSPQSNLNLIMARKELCRHRAGRFLARGPWLLPGAMSSLKRAGARTKTANSTQREPGLHLRGGRASALLHMLLRLAPIAPSPVRAKQHRARQARTRPGRATTTQPGQARTSQDKPGPGFPIGTLAQLQGARLQFAPPWSGAIK